MLTFSNPDLAFVLLLVCLFFFKVLFDFVQTTYTVCKIIFKDDPRDLSSSSSSAPGGGGEVEHNHSQFTHMNNSGEFEVGLHLFSVRKCDNDFICILPFFSGVTESTSLYWLA